MFVPTEIDHEWIENIQNSQCEGTIFILENWEFFAKISNIFYCAECLIIRKLVIASLIYKKKLW
jgi:hypothetical protein